MDGKLQTLKEPKIFCNTCRRTKSKRRKWLVEKNMDRKRSSRINKKEVCSENDSIQIANKENIADLPSRTNIDESILQAMNIDNLEKVLSEDFQITQLILGGLKKQKLAHLKFLI